MLRLDSDYVGGMYVFTIFIRLLFGNIILVCRAYSFPDYDSIFRYFLTYVARPPLVLSGRCYYTSWYPSIFGVGVLSATHVSCKHIMSRFSYSNNSIIFA